jgi:branched-subunit amino acid ABC-type transport system permease component
VVVVGGVGKLAGAVWAGLGIGTLNKMLEPATFGAAVAVVGLIAALSSWVYLVVHAFRQSRKWGWLTLLVPLPLPFAIHFRSRTSLVKAFSLYLAGVAATIIGLFRDELLPDLLAQDIRAIWAKVLILLAVVSFIQWRPAGLFPPKGRLADV